MHRIEKAKQLLKKYEIDALVIDNPIDIFYLTGEELSLGRLVIDPEKATLVIDGRYFEQCSKNPLVVAHLTAHYEKNSAFGQWWPYEGKKVGFDAHFCSCQQFKKLEALGSQLIALNSPLNALREIKDEDEIAKLKKSAALAARGYEYILGQLKEGISEKELAALLEIFWLRSGGDKLAFTPIIAFGENSSKPHYRSSAKRKLQKADLVLFDIGVVLDHYYSDMTRVVCFKEKKDEHQKIYDIVYEAHMRAKAIAKEGAKIDAVDQAARGFIVQKGYGERFNHGLGHGVGLEIHEAPRLSNISEDKDRALMKNMAVTIEPGIYLPAAFGVRLEDTYIIQEDGCMSITDCALHKELQVIS